MLMWFIHLWGGRLLMMLIIAMVVEVNNKLKAIMWNTMITNRLYWDKIYDNSKLKDYLC